ncbi:MAG TPA: alpha/beta fold hydrolase [Dehalococcoidia bacterium]|nr:alpha/beta fold hydrolase [Dehalococcoidia bacterium]
MDVIPGEAVRFASGDLTLEGMLHLANRQTGLPEGEGPAPSIVIAHPHPQMGGDMYNNVVGTLVRAATEVGWAALRFNFRGVGESDGRYDNGTGEQDDVRAAVDYLRTRPEVDGVRVAVAGYSFGAMMAARVATGREDLAAAVLVSIPTQRGPTVELGLPMPALFVTGDRDEYCDPDLLLEFREQIGPDVAVEVLEGVDHFWWGSDERLAEIVGGFLGSRVTVS